MFQIPFDEKLQVAEYVNWAALKYGFCSYFALAYADKHPSYDEFLVVMEYDEELEKHYLVHFLVMVDDVLIDAYGTYTDWYNSVCEMMDIEFMDLSIEEVDREFIVNMIKEDIGFDEKLYDSIREFVNKAYC